MGSDSVGQDILLAGRTHMNRAMDGRFVGFARTVYTHTIYDRVFGDSLSNIPYIHRIYIP